MSFDDVAIRVQGLSKCYQIYETPSDRLKQFIVPRLQRLTGRPAGQYFREFWALKDVSFEIRKGETVGIVGRNGSGKSTLLQIICGTLSPTGGTVETRGRIAALLELGSGFNPEFTGRENVYLNAAVLGLSKAEVDARFDAIADFADIGEFIEQPVKTYSSGMFVRLAFAIQANVDPEILIVDEALAVGDAYFVHRCMARFHKLQERGTTIVFVSHDASAVKRLCSRAVWLKNGHLILDGNATAVIDAYIQDLFGLDDNKTSNDAADFHGGSGREENDFSSKLVLPPGDGRYGAGALAITGMLLSDMNGLPTSMVGWNEVIRLLLEISNNELPPGQAISTGYIVRDSKGIEIASANTRWQEVEVYAPAQGGYLRVLIEVTIPMLHPGYYSLTPSVSSIEADQKQVVQDRILNAIVFEVTTSEEIVTPMRFATKYSVFTSERSMQNHGVAG